MMPGRLFAVVGPSGAGKDSLMQGARLARPDLHVVRRVITRPEAAGGEPFEGVSEAEFERRRAAGAFALDWQAHGLSYGIPLADCAKTADGADVIFNGSRAALPDALRRFPRLEIVLVTAPAFVLAARLAMRARESATDIEERLIRAGFSMPPDLEVRTVRNDGTLADGIAQLLAALQPESA